nr:HAD family hydrolase [Gordonia aichiensis]
MTSSAIALLTELRTRSVFVPVTTRTPEQFASVCLPGGTTRYGVVSSGGRILVNGTDDEHWRTSVEQAVAARSAPLKEVTRRLDVVAEQDWVTTLRTADDLFCYLVVDPHRQPDWFLPEWEQWCVERGWVASQQGRKIYAVPDAVTKSAAVAEVYRRCVDEGSVAGDDPVFAAGDGRLDVDLLEFADAAIRPAHGELAELNWQHPSVTVTSRTGALAGEEILEWLLSAVTRQAKTAI